MSNGPLWEQSSVKQTDVFEAAEYFARVEGILPTPESSHAIRVAIDEALKCKDTGAGYFVMVAYEKFHDGEMSDYILPIRNSKTIMQSFPK